MGLSESLVISFGLEVHITVSSRKKIFNWGDTYQSDITPNNQVGPWELGYLGVLPIINPEVIDLGLKLATALKMEISPIILFDRKIYNYFDLPKGYQITQQAKPLATAGYLPIIQGGKIEKIPIKSLQLEEDAAKSSYNSEEIELDFNRAGNPLIELVTEPIFSRIETVLIFIKQFQNLCRYADISHAKMEKGQLRVDLNFSLRRGKDYVTPRYEIKNLNSLANIEKAVKYEITKHQELFLRGEKPPLSQTLGFDERKQATIIHREKTDYFYLPEVNIPPIKLSGWGIKRIVRTIPILPWEKWEELVAKGVDITRVNLVLEKPLLLKTWIFGEKKTFLLGEYNNWTTFFLNYLSHFLTNDNFILFQKKWQSYRQLYQSWKNKELENQEIKAIAEQLITTKKSWAYFWKKYRPTKEIDYSQIFTFLEKLWDVNLAQKYSTKPQSVQNYLFGKLKKNFSNHDSKKINQIIANFINKMMNKDC